MATIFKKRKDYLIFGGLVLAVTLIIVLRLDATTQQNITVLENQELIKAGLNASQSNQELLKDAVERAEINTELILYNEQVVEEAINETKKVYEQIQLIAETIDNNTSSNREMISFIRNAFDEQFLAEYRQNQILEEQKHDIMLLRLTNGSQAILDMLTRGSAPRSSPG